jgi:hypothetical protein
MTAMNQEFLRAEVCTSPVGAALRTLEAEIRTQASSNFAGSAIRPDGGDELMSDDQDDQRRRQHPRIDAKIPVRISTIEADKDPWSGRPFFRSSQETCSNLSRGGAFVRTGELLEPGRRVLLEISLPNGGQIETIGRVAWTKRTLEPRSQELDTGVGIEFIGGSASQLMALVDYVERGE